MRKSVSLLVGTLIAAFVLSSACATVFRGRTQWIPVTSTPIGARVSVDGEPRGVTPVDIKLPRKAESQVIRIDLDGYDPVEIRPKRKMSAGPVIGNFLLGVPPGLVPALAWNMANDESPNAGSTTFLIWAAGAVAIGGILTAIDGGGGAGYELAPRELIVWLTKVKGTPVTRTVLLEPGGFENVKWIRVRKD